MPSNVREARLFAAEIKKAAKLIESYDDGDFKYEKWQTKGKKVFVFKMRLTGCLKEIGWMHSLTGEYEPIWVFKRV